MIPRADAAMRGLARRALPVLQLGARRLLGRKSPFQVTLSLTNRCNFRCDYCHIPMQRIDEMTTTQWLSAIDSLRAAGMGRASIIGGEPLLREDAPEIVRHLKRSGAHVSMNTNGWFIADRIGELSGLDLACITLDGPEAVHDRQRREGSYARVLRAIECLRARGVTVVTMTVVTAGDIDHVDHVLDVARAHGIPAYFQLEHDARMDVRLPIASALSQDRVKDFARGLIARKRAGAPVGNSEASLVAQAERRRLLSCDECWAGTYHTYVFSDGTVSHCLLTRSQVPVANGLKEGFAEAFEALGAPEGPGCSCVPSFEVNRALDLDPRAFIGALAVASRR